MQRLLTIIFTLIILLGSMVMIGLLGMGEFSGGEGFLRVCRPNEGSSEKDNCFWIWNKNEKDPYLKF